MGSPSSVTVGERILVHLAGYARFGDAYECPVEMTQDGIAAALGISRAHAALELKRLEGSGRAEVRMAHVAGARTRRKVYVLTPAGQEVARRMREHVRGKRVTLRTPAGVREASGTEAIEALRGTGVREMEAVQRLLVSDWIEALPRAQAEAPVAPRRRLLGREQDLGVLRAWLSADGAPFAVLVGVAGIGKTALLARALEEETRPVLLRRAYAHDDLHGLLSSAGDFLARIGRRRLKAVLTKPAYDPQEALAVLREDLAGTVLAVDDLHASPAAESLLGALLAGPPAGKVIAASRVTPSFYDRSDVAAGRVLEHPLAGLSEEAAAELLASKGASLSPEDLARILRATRGHPLALELFAASGLEAGEAATERYVLETVLAGLEEGAEDVLRAFAVLRRPAPYPQAFGATVAQLRRLTKIAILQHRDDGYQLHDLVREFFLARMDADARRRDHARAAAYWEDRGDVLEAAHHRIEAGEPERAAALLLEGGEPYADGARAGDLEACLLRLPPDLRPGRLLAETDMFLGKFPEAKAALEGLAKHGSPRERLQARIQLGRIASRLGSYAEARGILEDAAREATRREDRALEAEALRALGGVERKSGDLARALAHLARAVDLLPDGSRERVRGLLDLGATLIAKGDLAGATARLQEAARRARKGSREEAAIENNLAIVLSREGRAEEAAKAFERSAHLALRTGEVRVATYALANAADNLLRLDATDAAALCAERALSLAETIRDPVALSTARVNLGLVHARRGDWAKAEEHMLASVDLLAQVDNPYSLAGRCEELARLYEAQGRAGDAAPWRARARDFYARLGPGPAGPKGS